MVGAGDGVSAREAEVLAAVAEHLTNAEIGQRLHISVRTVESHVSSLLRKLGVADRRALARYGRELAGDRADRADDALASPTAAVTTAAPDGATLQGAPAALTSFVGRRADLMAVEDALAAARLVSLVGPGGVGKTRLAIEAGARAAGGFPGGAWFVDLVPVRTGGVTTAIAAALGIVDRPNRSLEDVVEEALRASRSLLIVDNCEHVLDAAATLLRRLLVTCPGLRVVATSRELLGITGERVVPVAPLDGPEAVTLFVDRVRSLDPGFDPASERDSVAEVCARLDGIPLAIELASARCAVLGLDGVRAGLRDRLRLLAGARPAEEERHRSLRDVLDWSHGLLDPTEQTVLRRLSVFAGNVVTADATAVVADGIGDDAALDAIGRLTAKSLVARRARGASSVYRLLETVHEYARERLDESGEGEAVRRRHLAWALDAVAATESRLVAGDEWRSRFDDVADDARVALAWAADEPAVLAEAHTLARAYAHVAYARRFLSEARACYDTAAALAGDDATAAADLRLAAAVAFAQMRGDLAYDRYLASAERGAEADPAGAAIALADAATIAWRCPAEFPTVPTREQVHDLAARAHALDPGDDPVVAAHLTLADAWIAPPEPVSADLGLARAAVDAARALDDLPLLSAALDAETVALWDDGRDGEAMRVAVERLALLDRLSRHDPRTGGEVIDIFHMAADTALSAGRPRAALDHAALMRKDEMGETSPHAATREAVVALALLGRFAEAIAEADAMRRDWERAGRPSAAWMTPAVTAATLAHGLLGDRQSSDEWAELAWEVCGSGPARWVNHPFRAFATARIAFHEGRLDDALAAIADWEPADPSGYVGYYMGYPDALGAELAVVAGHDGAADRIATARDRSGENSWARACLLRAEGRLRSDPDLLRAALTAFDEIDSRFEWAITALLVGGDVAADGRAALAELGVALPG
jgi:predicted ATPase/DNA-binding CsgD family transcriptional regulator